MSLNNKDITQLLDNIIESQKDFVTLTGIVRELMDRVDELEREKFCMWTMIDDQWGTPGCWNIKTNHRRHEVCEGLHCCYCGEKVRVK